MNFEDLLNSFNKTLDFKLKNKIYVSDNYVLKMLSNSFFDYIDPQNLNFKIRKGNILVYAYELLILNFALSKTHITTTKDEILTNKKISLKEIVLKGHTSKDKIVEIFRHAKNIRNMEKHFSEQDILDFFVYLEKNADYDIDKLKMFFYEFIKLQRE
ncbi:hypothetical protein [Campylobacter sp. JMF_03 NE3]|uniref:hypothetical protein n=1 Tax=Campylobacter sp. JMF_03 NE3 TaxID=2983831 RepID=UPI0022E9A64C|nr:hypothetical protein [Campylobacter sp. JMF_03 NE3]MDA3053690.1 hypothetical protein [Campylobacter sp. JMF_03 NE3]